MTEPQTPPPPFPGSWAGLLPWQALFSAWILGLLAWQWPMPAGLGLAIFAWCWLRPDGCVISLRPLCTWIFLFVTAFALGTAAAHFSFPRTSPHPDLIQALERDHSRAARVSGEIVNVLSKPGRRLQMILDDVTLERTGQEPIRLQGRLLWTWQDPPTQPLPGQRASATLRVRPIRGMANPGCGRTEDYWAMQGVYFRTFTQATRSKVLLEEPGKRSWVMREQLRQRLLEHSPQGQGQAMLLALLMGDRLLLDQETMDLVRRAGLAHSLALSGMHLGFVITMGWMTAHLIGRAAPRVYLALPRPKLAVILSIPLVLAYLWLGQAVPSLLRAALMFAFWGALLLLGRSRILLDGLFLALVAILAYSPLAIFDLRLLLSALAVAGLALAWPLVGRNALSMAGSHWWHKPLRTGLGILAVSLVANLALLPVLAWFFGYVTPHLYLNVPWLPLLGLVVFPLGFCGMLLLILPGGQAAAGMLLSLACHVLEAMIGGLAWLDQAGLLAVHIPARPLWPQFLGYWMLLAAAAVWWGRPRALRPGIIALALCLLLVPPMAKLGIEQRRAVTLRLLDVGQGLAVVVESAAGKRWLVDGGGFPWTREFDIGQAVISPTLTHGRPPRLNGVFLTHPSKDHYLGLFYPLKHFHVGGFFSQGRWPKGEDGEELEGILHARGIARSILRKGETHTLDRDLVLEVLHPDEHWVNTAPNDNDTSLVLRLVWRGRPLALITGDAEIPSLAAILRDGADLRAEVLILPHHGSRTSLSRGLYDRVEPRVALVGAGYLNQFHHPHPEVVRALEQRNIPLLSTAEFGAITVHWSRPSAPGRVRTERHGPVDI